MSVRTLVAVGTSATTALGRALLADTSVERLGPDAELDPAIAGGIVIGAATADPVSAALTAAAGGRSVLVEPVARCGSEGLRAIELAASGAGVLAAVAFRRRFEPDLGWARGSIASGSIGLPWGVHAEALRAAAADALTESLDLLDAVTWASGLRPSSIVSIGAPSRKPAAPGVPVVLSVALDHGGVGQVVARSTSVDDPFEGPEAASFRVTGSHGTIVGDLDGPALDRQPDARSESGRERVDPSGTGRLLVAFRSVALSDGPAASLVSTAAAADLLDLVSPPTRARRKG
jgi:predicted dehydrogenase